MSWAGFGRDGEFPVEPLSGHWQNPAFFQRRLMGSTRNRRTRPEPVAEEAAPKAAAHALWVYAADQYFDVLLFVTF